jgi:hypothetical protein
VSGRVTIRARELEKRDFWIAKVIFIAKSIFFVGALITDRFVRTISYCS